MNYVEVVYLLNLSCIAKFCHPTKTASMYLETAYAVLPNVRAVTPTVPKM